MRNLFLLLFLIFSTTALAQDTYLQEDLPQRDVARNEVSLNILNVLVFGALDASYERILSPYSSLSVEMFSKVFNKNEGEDVDLSRAYTKDFSLTTKFKYFFQEQNTAWGFYAEGFGMYSDGVNEKDREITDSNGQTTTKEVEVEYNDLAIGFGVGGKFVGKTGFLIDVSFGFGRNMFHRDSPDLVVLPNINVGYRF